MSKLKMYTGKLTGNRRDTGFCPKALLLNIVDENGIEVRDHMWVELTKTIEKVQPQGHKKAIKVEIEAIQFKYNKSEDAKVSFKITNIKKQNR